ncbi:MAG TPA: nucleotidyltransferase domain-containing protein [Candidatus Binatia bacterium]|nr:nucleotidyltransferase domain-containing protein [Candidatus Binatia bacterium]
MSSEFASLDEPLARVSGRHPKLRTLVLFGSRARGDARERSDWDLGYLADEGFDPDALLLDLVNDLGTDRIDLVDLARAGAQVRFRAASDGRALYEAEPGVFGAFWIEAVDFWCDAGPMVRDGYAEALARLRR